jgi:hypothetical protein
MNDGQFGINSGHFGFNVRAEPAQVVLIEGSLNLWQWVPLRTNLMSSSQFYFSDPTPAVLTTWFYRVRLYP